mgnify:CR=1 FL=1
MDKRYLLGGYRIYTIEESQSTLDKVFSGTVIHSKFPKTKLEFKETESGIFIQEVGKLFTYKGTWQFKYDFSQQEWREYPGVSNEVLGQISRFELYHPSSGQETRFFDLQGKITELFSPEDQTLLALYRHLNVSKNR